MYIYILFFLKYIMCDKTHHFMGKNKYFTSDYGIITGIIIKLCKKSCRKKKWVRLKKSNLPKL